MLNVVRNFSGAGTLLPDLLQGRRMSPLLKGLLIGMLNLCKSARLRTDSTNAAHHDSLLSVLMPVPAHHLNCPVLNHDHLRTHLLPQHVC